MPAHPRPSARPVPPPRPGRQLNPFALTPPGRRLESTEHSPVRHRRAARPAPDPTSRTPMAKQPSGEGKAPLVISVVFFVLLSIGLGVMLYMAGDEKAQLRSAAKDAADKAAASEKLRAAEQE